jgi:hypothetical protein
MWYVGNYGIELNISKRLASIGYHSGDCEKDILWLKKQPKIKSQLKKINKENLVKELNEMGAWSEEELKNHDNNINRILWIACADIVDGK